MEVEYVLMAVNVNIGAVCAVFFLFISLISGILIVSSDLLLLFNVSSGMWNFIFKIEIFIFNVGCN